MTQNAQWQINVSFLIPTSQNKMQTRLKKINSQKVFKKPAQIKTKGFTLLETMVAIFVFTVLITMLSGSFLNFHKIILTQRSNQRNLENAQLALNLMEKTIRSSVVYQNNTSGGVITLPSGNVQAFDFTANHPLDLFDNSQNTCVQYSFDSTSHKMKIATKSGATITTLADCGDFSWAVPVEFSDAIIENVSGSGWPTISGAIGRVTVALSVKDTVQNTHMMVQMTASLRN